VIQGKAAAVAVAKVVAVYAVRVGNKDVLESGTSAVRGSQVKMAGLPRLTRQPGLFLSPMLLQAS
jgi:hypothetical protein